MVQGEANPHVQKEEDSKPAKGLKIAGEEGCGRTGKAQDEQDSCGSANGALVEHRDVDALNFFAEGGLRSFLG